MKTIKKKLQVFEYTFGNVDLASGSVYGVETLIRTRKIAKKVLDSVTEQTGKLLINMEQSEEVYELPADKFIEACRAYATEVEDTEDEDTEDQAIEE